jgi:ATP-dependent DNA helicase RecG
MERIDLPEGLRVEFKSDVKKLPDSEIVEAVVAFANTDGGDLYIGVEDDGAVTGVHPEHRDVIRSAAMVANKTVPPAAVSTELVASAESSYQIMRVQRSPSVMATASGKTLRRRLKADGSPENVPLYPFEVTHRLSGLKLLDFSAQPVPEATTADLDPVERERLRNVIRRNPGEQRLLELPDDELDLSLRLVTRVGDGFAPTFAGLVLIGRQERLAELVPTAESALSISQGTRLRVNDTSTTPLLAAFERVEAQFQAWNRETEVFIGLVRVAVPDVDPGAFREALVNAYAHRDYSLLGRVRVDLSDEGATVANPGGFVEGVSLDNLLGAEPQGRNPALADALKRIGLAERTGRGIDRIFEGSLAYGRPAPDYSSSTANTVSVFLSKTEPDVAFMSLLSEEQRRRGSTFSLRQLMILHLLWTRGELPPEAIVAHVGGEPSKATAALAALTREGLVTPDEARPGLAPRLLPDRAQPAPDDAPSQRQAVLALAGREGLVRRSDVVGLLGVAEPRAYRLLRSLVASGQLVLVGRGKGSAYSLPPETTSR